MPTKYKHNGFDFTEDQVQQAANSSNMSVEDYIKKAGIEIIEEDKPSSTAQEETQSFQTDPVKETAVAGSTDLAVDTELLLETTSLASQDPDPKPKSKKFIELNEGDSEDFPEFLFEDDYLDFIKNNPDKRYPSTFEAYAKALKKEIRVDPVEVFAKRSEINIPLTKDVDKKQLQKQLINAGFGYETLGDAEASSVVGVRAQGQLQPFTTKITASNGNEFLFNDKDPIEQVNVDLNAFLNANKPTGGSKPFIKKHGYTNADFESGLINGVKQKPSYQLLDNISRGIDKVLGIYYGRKNLTIEDTNLSYNDFFTFAEDTSIDSDSYMTAAINTTVEYLKVNNYIDPDNTNPYYIRNVVKDVLQKNNYIDVVRSEIAIEKQKQQEFDLGNIRLEDYQIEEFQDNIVENSGSVDLQARYNKVKDIDIITANLNGYYASLSVATDPTVIKNLNTRIALEESKRDAAYAELSKIPIENSFITPLIGPVYSTFTDENGNLRREKLSEEAVQELFDETKEFTQEEVEALAATYGLNMRESLGMSYENVIREYMYLDAWSEDTKVSIKYRGGSEPEVNKLWREFLGVDEMPKNISVKDFIEFDNYLTERFGGQGNLIQAEGPDADLYRKHRQSLDIKRAALDDLYLYNINPADIEDNIGSMFFESALVATVGEKAAPDIKLGLSTGRSRLDNMQKYFNEYNATYSDLISAGVLPEIVLNNEQIEALQRDWFDEAAEATGGMVPMLVEFAVLNYATGGALSLTGGARFLAQLKRSKNVYDKFKYHGIQAILEEAKFDVIEGEFAVGQGSSFYTINELFKSAPGLKGKKSFFNALIRNTFGTGVSGATASNFSQLVGEYKKKLYDDGNFTKYLEQNFTGEDVDLLRKWSIEAVSFSAFGPLSLKKENFSWKTYQKNSADLLRATLTLKETIGVLKENPKQNAGRIAELESMLIDYQKLSIARNNNWQFQVENPRIQENVTRFVNQSLSELNSKSGDAVVVKFVEKQNEMDGSIDPKDKAFYNKATNTMYFVKSKFNEGVMMHELNHAALKKHLDLNPNELAVFNKNILAGLEKSTGLKGEALKEAIKREYGLDMPEQTRTEEFTSWVYELMNTSYFADKFIENPANQSIWGYVSSEVNAMLGRAGVKENIDAENIFSVMQNMSGRALEGKDISKQVAKIINAITTGEKVQIEKPQEGLASRDLILKEEQKIEELTDLLSQDLIDIDAYERGVDAAEARIKELANPTFEAKKQPAVETKPDVTKPKAKLTQQEMNQRVDDLVTRKDKTTGEKTGEPWKSKEEFQSSKEFRDMYRAIIEGNLIDPLIMRGIEGQGVQGMSMQEFVQDVKTGGARGLGGDLTSVLMSFDPTKNDSLIGWINSNLFNKKGDALKRAARTNQESSNYETAVLENMAAAEVPSYEKPTTQNTGKGVVAINLVGDPSIIDAAKKEVAAALEQGLKIDDLNFSTTPILIKDALSKFFLTNKWEPNQNLTLENTYRLVDGETGQPITETLANGDKKSVFKESELEKMYTKYPNAKRSLDKLSEIRSVAGAIERLGPQLLKLFPELNIASTIIKQKPEKGETATEVEGGFLTNQGIPGTKETQGASLNLPGTLLKVLYEPVIKTKDGKQARGQNPKSQTAVQQLRDLSYKEFLQVINGLKEIQYEKPEGMSSADWLKYRRDTAQVLKGVMTWYAKASTNELLRRDETLAAVTRANLESGKPVGMASKDIKIDDKSKQTLEKVLEKTKEEFGEDDIVVTGLENEIQKIISNNSTADQAINDLLYFVNNNASATKYKSWTQSIQPLIVDMFQGKITEAKALEYIGRFREIHRYEEQTAGYNISKKDLYNRVELTSNDVEAQQVLINEWLRNVSRGGRNLGIDGTTNQDVYKNVIKPLELLYPELKGKYKVVSNKKRGKARRTWITNNGVTQRTYNNIYYIKQNFAGLKDVTAAEALEAKEYIWREIDSKIKSGDTGGAKTLLSSWLIDQRGPMRKLAQLGFMQTNIKGKSILEHEIPVKDVYDALIDYVNDPTAANKETANNLIDNSRVHLISAELDALLPKLGQNRYQTPEFKAELDRLRSEGNIFDTQQTPQGNASKEISLTKEVSERLDLLGNVPKDISAAQAKAMGQEVDSGVPNWLKLKIDPEAQDFLGLMQSIVPAGKEGERVQAEHKKLFTDTFNRAYNQLDADTVYVSSNYRNLKKSLKISNKRLEEKIGDTYFTNEHAVRVFMWNRQDREIPGISQKEKANLIEHVRSNKDLMMLAMQTSRLNKGFGLAEPQENWTTGSISGDLMRSIETLNRPAYLRQWQANVDAYFTEGNLNKMEALFGTRWRKSMENSLERQKTGKNRYYSADSQVGKFADQLSGAVLNTLNLNNKSALLQLTSATNFIDWKDNNPIAASKAFANQPQYWQDVRTLMMSDFLKQRRSGLKIDINDADIADLAKKGGFTGLTARLLKLGMTPTVIADNIAIAGGGATFYRNKINRYLKEGLSQAEAEKKAFEDFREKAETSQQSNRPDKISMQQAGPLGRIVLAYTNTPQQYLRETNKALNDIKNGRGNYKENVAKIAYYQFMQNMMFTALQQGVKGALFDEEEVVVPDVMSDEEFSDYYKSLHPSKRAAARKKRELEVKERDAAEKESKKKTNGYTNTINGMLDTGLKGMGLAGQVISTFKNAAFRAYLEGEKDNPDWAGQVPKDLLAISPGLSTKYGQMQRGLRTIQYNWDEIEQRGLGDIENPIYSGIADIGAALTNAPLNRIVTKSTNVKNFFNEELSTSQRVLSLGGWSPYALGIERTKWSKQTPEEIIKLQEWKEEQFKLLHPSQRSLFLQWQREQKKRIKNKK